MVLAGSESEDAHVQVSDDLRVGTELAGYRIESLLGLGGMSIVYLAEDLRLKRKVALKVLAASLAEDESFRERFLRESELAASIDHPNIVPIYEAGTTEDLLFIAMRYVEGRDLKMRLGRGPLAPGDATGILAQVASALDAAHARGLVHRDVKPSNVLLDTSARPDGSDHVYLADFGLMKQLSEEAGEEGHLFGTIDYVAPEQIAGDEIDWRADVYSLGCVLYECLVGQPPFRRDSDLAVVFAHLDVEPPAPSALRPELPPSLDAVIARALAKEPAERYPSCRALAQGALAVSVDEASRMLADAASRAAAGRDELSAVEADLAGRVTDLQLAREHARVFAAGPAGPAPAETRPFKGLASFEPVDADYFFGRERLVAELVARLVGAGFLGIVGPSGSGKSSVLRAGLLPALAGGVLPGSARWRRWLLRPGERPLDELGAALGSGAKDPLADALDALPAHERLLLAVDQLEELFTACRSEAERAAFAETLARAASDPDRRAVVVVALRADYYGRFAAYPQLAELLGSNHVLVGPMQASELRRAVELPAARVGLQVEPELTNALVDDVEGEPGALPLLSTALLELWQLRAEGTLTLAAYRESGGVHGAVARLAEGTYAGIPEARRQLVRAVMLRLVGEGGRHAPVRRRAPLDEFDLERDEDVAEVLASLTDTRLVTIGEGSVEVAHEALLREWPRLRDWIEEDAEGRRLRRHITRAATDWDQAGRDEGELYRGARLAAALDWSTDRAADLNELEREFVTESREASEQDARRATRTNRRLRTLLAGVAGLLAAAVAGGIYALVQRGEARDAETAQLAQRLGAQALVEEDLDLSLLLARQAVAIDDSPQTRGYLLAALQSSPAAIGIMHGPTRGSFLDIVRTVAVNPDGKTVAVGGEGGLLLFDARTFEPIEGPPAVASFVESLAYSPNGKTLAVGAFDGVRLLDARTYELVAASYGNGPVTHLAFTSNGSRLVAVESPEERDGSISILDGSTLNRIGSSIQPKGFKGWWIYPLWANPSVALTHDGRSLVTTSRGGGLTWWDLVTHKKTKNFKIEDGRRALALSPDGRTAGIGLDDGIQLLDLRTGVAREARGVLPSNPNWLLFSPDGRTLVSTGADGAVTLWDVDTLTIREALRGHSEAAWQPVFSPDGKTLYTTSNDGTAIAWDMTQKRRFGQQFRFARGQGVLGWPYEYVAKFSPDGRLIAVGLKNRGIEVRAASDLSPTGVRLLRTGGEVTALAFGRDGRTLAAVTRSGMATVWDLKSRSLQRGPFRVDSTSAVGVSISADGGMLATAGEHGAELWNVATGDSLGHIGDYSAPGDIAFSPTGPLVAFVRDGYLAGGGGDVEIWDAARRSRVRKIRADALNAFGWALAFSPDGRTIATGGLDTLVHFWDVRTGKLVRELQQNVGSAVLSLEFSPDGRILAISGGEAFASLWDVAKGVPIGPKLRVGGGEVSLDISPDGRRLLTTHGNGKATIWNIDPASWSQRACRLANRALTREEWEEFLPGRRYEPACS
jgi:WD40 repeat protein/tRNA A-37 threonylcarbamoyl transferase component Bud32